MFEALIGASGIFTTKRCIGDHRYADLAIEKKYYKCSLLFYLSTAEVYG